MGPTKLDLALATEVVTFLVEKQPDAVDALRALHLASLIILEELAKEAKEEMS